MNDNVGLLPYIVYKKAGWDPLSFLGDVAGSFIGGIFGLGSSAMQSSAASEMSESQRKWQEQEWTRQFEMTNERQDELNEYASPANQSARMREAGFNPAAIASGSTNTVAQPTPTTTQVPHASPQTTPITPSQIGVASVFESIGSLIKNLASAKKDGADTTRIQSLLQVQLDNAFEELNLKRILVETNKLDLSIKKLTKDATVNKAFEEYLYLVGKTCSEYALGKQLSSQGDLNVAMEKFYNTLEGLTFEQKMQAIIMTSNYQRLLDSTIKRNEGSAAASYASVGMYQSQTEYNYALAQTENLMREGKITMQQLQNESIRIANTVGSSNMRTFVATEQDRLKALVSEYERQGFITETARANMQQAITNANWSEIEKYLGAMSQALNTVTGIYNAGSMRIGSLSQLQRNQVQSEFNRILDSHWSPNEPKPIHGFGYNVNQ